MKKVLYRPLGLVISAVGGLAARALFKQFWQLLGHEDEAPEALQEQRSWREILPSAAIQGAIFGLVTAAVDRAGAQAFRKATGTWPGKE